MSAKFSVPQTPQAIAPTAPSPTLNALTTGMQAVNDNAAAMQDAIEERLEYTLDQQRKRYISETTADIENQFILAMSFPDGHEKSFWNADGSFRNDFYNATLKAQLSRLDDLDNGYVRPESQRAAADATAELKEKIASSFNVKVAQSLAPRAKSATLDLAKWQAEQGDYISSAATIKGCPDYALSDFEKQQALIALGQTRIVNDAKTAALNDDFDAYLKLVADEKAMRSLTPDQYHQVLALQSRFADTDPPADQLSISSSSSSSSEGKKDKPFIAKKPLPLGVTDDLVALHSAYLDADGNFPKAGEPIRQATAAISNFAAHFVHANLTEEERQHFFNIADSFNISKEDASAILDKYALPFALKKGGFDIAKEMKELDQRFFIPLYEQSRLSELSAKRTSSANKNKEESVARLDSRITLLTARAEQKRSELKDSIISQFSDWLATQDKEKLTDVDCRMALYNIIDSTMDEAANTHGVSEEQQLNNPFDFSSSLPFRSTAQAYEAATSARAAADERRSALDAKTAITDRQRAHAEQEEIISATHQFSGEASFSLSLADSSALENSTTESYLAVPSSSPMVGKTLILRSGRRTRAIPCRLADVEAPTFSMRARLNLGLLHADSHFSITHDADGNAILTNNTPKAEEANIYRIMLGNEVRRDRSGRPVVYALPTEDGGGTHEVAGLNTKYNPTEFAELKRMIDSGASTAAIENYICAAYKNKTQFSVKLLGYRYSQGIELFMRDCALNHSPEGVRKILSRAVGASSNFTLSPAVCTFVQQHGEAALLRNLAAARAWYYQDVATRQPQKAIFMNGWMNRNRNMANAAYSLLYTPAQ